MGEECNPGCLNGAQCLNGTCLCSTTPYQTRDDVTIFYTGNTCAVIVPVMIAVYALAIVLSFSIGFASWLQVRKHTLRRNRILLTSNGFASMMTGVFAAVHWAEGYRLGPASTVVMGYTLVHINIQISFVQYLLFSILMKGSADNTSKRLDTLKRLLFMWNGFWVTGKVVVYAVFLAAHYQSSMEFFNFSVFFIIIFVIIEIMCQSFMTSIIFSRIYRNLIAAQSVAEMTGTHTQTKQQQVRQFGKKLLGQMRVIFYYGFAIMGLTVAIITLFAVFNAGQIPFVWVLFAGYIITWPTLCIGPIMLLKEVVIQGDDKTNIMTSDEINNAHAHGPHVHPDNGLEAGVNDAGPLVSHQDLLTTPSLQEPIRTDHATAGDLDPTRKTSSLY